MVALRGPIYMSLGAASLVVNDAITKILTTQMPVTQVIMIRAVTIAAICLLLLRLKNRPWVNPFHKDILIRTGFTVGNAFAFVAAVSILPLSTAVLVDYSNILFVILAAPFILNEQLTRTRLIAVCFGLSGAALILSPEFKFVGLAVFIPVISGLLGAGRELWTRRLRETNISAEELTLLAALGMIFVAPLSGVSHWPFPEKQNIALAMLAGGFQGLALILMAKAFFFGESAAVAPFRLTAIVWALLLAYFVFGDRATPLQIIGIGIIVSALLLATYETIRLQRINSGSNL